MVTFRLFLPYYLFTKVWKGFSEEYDYCTIYAPAECGLSMFDKYKDMTFRIKDTEVFDYSPSYWKYDMGAKIWVVKCESSLELRANYIRLKGIKFRARLVFMQLNELSTK